MKNAIIERTLLGLLLVIAGGIVIHTPMTLWLGVQWPAYELYFKAWKEVLMGVGLVLLLIVAAQRGKVKELLSDRLMQLSLAYAALHLALLAVFGSEWQSAAAGLLIDLRYVLFFVLVYGLLRLEPGYRRTIINVMLGGAVVVLGFALLQIFVLPKDILAHIGYSKATISPYLTVDENPAYIRINSTLRGPNPLGAYAVTILSVLAAVALRWKLGGRGKLLVVAGMVASLIAIWASHSRSSMIAAAVVLGVVALVAASQQVRMRVGILIATATVVTIGLVVALRDTTVVQNVVFHDSPTTGAMVDSNSGHVSSLIDGTRRLVAQPFGAGIGSTGSASLLGDKPTIIENQYLLVAHETGWIGLALFVVLYAEIMRRLWQRRQSALGLGMFASGIGLAIIGLLLPVWTDDTVSIIWWGLAAAGIGGWEIGNGKMIKKGERHGARKSN